MHSLPSNRGAILLLALVFLGVFMLVSTTLVHSLTAYSDSEQLAVAQTQALALAEAGMDKAAYQLNQSSSYTGETGTALGAGTFSITVTTVDSSTKKIVATGYVPNSANPVATKTITAQVGINNSVVSFHYGIQSGQGGFSMTNSSQITGNVFSGGPITMANSASIDGDVVSAGASGLISGGGNTITGSAYAHTLQSIAVGGDAYYVSQTSTKASGSNCPNSHCHSGSADQTTVPLPISDDQITTWENLAEAGGTITSCDGSGNYTISSNTTIGPKKIMCNLVLSGSATITVAGHLWVVGNITTSNSVTVKMDSSLGSQNVAIIADDPSNPTTKGIVNINSSGQFQGSGSPGSYVFIISQNKSAENGGSTTAISMSQSSNALVLYASHGKIVLTNSVSLKEVTAYLISLAQSVHVTYDSGLPSAAFQSGPGGSWTFTPGTYSITR